MKNETRGLRNCNPLNIRRNDTRWQGLRTVQSDPAFFQFETMAYGYRAAFRTLDTYRRKHGCVVLADYIARWAPPSENDTAAYLRTVCRRTRAVRRLDPRHALRGTDVRRRRRHVLRRERHRGRPRRGAARVETLRKCLT